MKILLVGSFEHPMYAPAFESGLRQLGHQVVSIQYEKYLYGKNLIGNFLTRLQNRYHYGLNLFRYNRKIIKAYENEHPDLIFLYRCYNIWPSTIRKLKTNGATVFTYNNDDPFSGVPSVGFYRYFHAIISLVDANFVYRKKNLSDYEHIGARNTRLLLPYYIEKNNYREDCKDDIPVAFLGHFEDDGRDQYIKALKDAGIPVLVFNGSDWEKAPLYKEIKSAVHPGKRGAEYNHTINRCKIALVFLSKINSDTYTRRCFEIPATETLMLSEYSDDLNEMFPANECAVYFRNEQELVEKCKILLTNEGERKRIARNGFQRVKELGGSEYDRCQEIIDFYNQYKNGK